jgi:DsbC/DsbD-like thiol-disulfide interchange protein
MPPGYAGLMRMLLVMAAAAALLSPAPAGAQSASGWSRDGAASLRLVAGQAGMTGTLSAGLEIRLDPGWQTYWRSPGDSGVAPRFDWSASDNLASVTVAWPVPSRLVEADGVAIGYRGRVMFPLQVTPEDPNRPVALAVRVDYAVCEKLCVPAEGKAEIRLDRGTKPDALAAATLAGFARRVPVPATLASDGPLSITAVSLERGGTTTDLIVDARAPPAAARVDLFAAGEGAMRAGVPQAEPVAGDGGRHRWRVPLYPAAGHRPSGTLGLVLATESGGIRVPITLDGLTPAP